MQDGYNDIDPIKAITVTRQTNSDTAIVSDIIDTANYERITFLLQTGAITDADVTVAATLEESAASDMSGSNQVAAADLIGTLAAFGFGFADDNTVRKLGYKGSKRYLRLTLTPTGNGAGNVDVACSVIREGKRKQP